VGEHCGADRDRVTTEFTRDDLSGFKARLESSAFSFLDDWIEDQLPRIHYAATEDYALDIEEIDNTGDTGTDVLSSSFNHHESEIVTFVGLVSNVVRSEIFV